MGNMSKETVTLVLEGKVTLADFVQAMEGVHALIESLQKESNAGATIDWVVDALEIGSAVTTFRGVATEARYASVVGDVVARYEETGRLVQSGHYDRLSSGARGAVQKIMGVLNGKITAVRLETETTESSIVKPSEPSLSILIAKPSLVCAGSVRGRVQALNSRGQLRFTLYDVIEDHAVSCYVSPGSEAVMKDVWGKMALVRGQVSRDSESGRPMSVRRIDNIEIIPEGQRGDWRHARGCAPRLPEDSLSPEEAIRRGRDA